MKSFVRAAEKFEGKIWKVQQWNSVIIKSFFPYYKNHSREVFNLKIYEEVR